MLCSGSIIFGPDKMANILQAKDTGPGNGLALNSSHDVIKWKHFPHNWPFVPGIHRSPVNSLHKGQWRGAVMFSLICVWRNSWENSRKAGDLRRYRAHYDVSVMSAVITCTELWLHWINGFNSLWPSDTMWWHTSGSTLAWWHQAITWTKVDFSSVGVQWQLPEVNWFHKYLSHQSIR